MNLSFRVDPDWLESLVSLGFIEGVTSTKELEDSTLRAYLEAEAEESKEVLNLKTIDEIVNRELRIKMADSNAKFRIRNLFVSDHTILSRNGLLWFFKDSQKVAVTHVLSAIRPATLKERLAGDLDFAHYGLEKTFKASCDMQ